MVISPTNLVISWDLSNTHGEYVDGTQATTMEMSWGYNAKMIGK
jgi:hypothetical protein